jgi:DNA-binding NtrC family response regulator
VALNEEGAVPNLLLIDDESDFSTRLVRALSPDYQVTWLAEADGPALDRLAAKEFALLLLDFDLPKVSGIDFLEKMEQREASVPVILITRWADPQLIIAAKKRGAFAYVQKQPTDELVKQLKPKIDEALEIWSPEPPVTIPGAEKAGASAARRLLPSQCQVMQEVYQQVGQAANIIQPLLILGEDGTGKDLVARALHDNGPRDKQPFVIVRCNTFDDELLRDELFGHEEGFRGKGQLRKGKIEHASGGTLYFDQVGELPLALQDDVLRVLEDHQVTRLGSNEALPVDVRVLSSSRQDLHAIPESKFRRELLAQLSAEIIHLPPLRDHLEDLEAWARYFLAEEAAMARKPRPPHLQKDCLAKLRNHPWPGNTKELRLVIRNAVVRAKGPRILPKDINFEENTAEQQAVTGLRVAVACALGGGKNGLYQVMMNLLKQELATLTMEACNGDTTRAEERLGVSLRDIFPSEKPVEPRKGPPLRKAAERRILALTLMNSEPDLTLAEYAARLDCAIDTLRRDPVILGQWNQLQEERQEARRRFIRRGYKRSDGTLEVEADPEE